jgi:hypothetical protein
MRPAFSAVLIGAGVCGLLILSGATGYPSADRCLALQFAALFVVQLHGAGLQANPGTPDR